MYKRLLLSLLMILSIQFGFAQNYIEIGNGNESTSMPFYSSWNYSWSSSIYSASEIGGAKTITDIAFDVIGGTKTMTNQKIYMKHISVDEFDGVSYEDPTNNGYTLVYEGDISFATGWTKITLSTPFNYNGTENVVIHVENNWGEIYGPNFNSTTSVINNAKNSGSDDSFPTGSGQYPYPKALTNIRIYYASGDSPATPSNPIPNMNSIKNALETELTFTIGANTTNYDLYFGTDESSMNKVVDNADATEGEYTYVPVSLLEAKTTYYWQVIVKNATTSESSPVWSFETEGAITEFPYYTGFEEKWVGYGGDIWYSYIINTNYEDSTDWAWDDGWNICSEPNVQDDSTAIYCSAMSDGEYNVQTPRIILPENYRVSFWWRNGGFESKVAGLDTTFFEISKDGGDNWTLLDTLSPAIAMTEWENSIVDLSAYSGNNVYLRWRYKRSDGTNRVFIDNLKIYAKPTGSVIELSEGEIIYNDVAINGYTKVPVIVRNTGSTDMNITSVSVASPFSCDYSGTVEAGKLDTVYIYFTPETVDTFNETLTFNSNAEGVNTVNLTGTGFALIESFYETFDEVKEIPEGWSHIDSPLGYISGGGVQVTGGSSNFYSDPYAAKLMASNDTISPIILLTPGVKGFAANTLTFMALKWDGVRDLNLEVGTMSDPYDASTFVTRQIVNLTDEFTEYAVTFKPSNTAPYIAFKHGGNPTGSDDWTSLRIDNIAWEANTEDVPLAAVLAAPVNNSEEVDIMNHPVLTWTAGSSNTDGFYVYLGISSTSFDVIDGENVETNPTKYEITKELEYNTRYYWKIVPYNNFGSCANNEVWSFKTMQDPTITELPWTENFDDVIATTTAYDRPVGWSVDNVQGGLTWDILVDNANFNPFAHSSPNSIHVGFGMNPKDDYLYTPPIRLEGGAYYELSFWMHTDMDMVTGQLYTEKLKVYAGLDNSISAMTTLLADTLVDDADYLQVKVEFNPENDGDYYFGFYACSDPMMYLLILDDVELDLVNSSPAFESSPVTDVKVGVTYNYAIEASDPNGDNITITATTKPSWLSFSDNSDGTATLLGIPSSVGDYDVVLTVSDGVFSVEQKFTITVTEGTTGINDLNESAHIVLAPNPAKSYVNIMVQESFTVPYQVQVVNIIGEVVYETRIDKNQYKLNLEGFDTGLYFVVIFDGNNKFNQKLIIR